MKKKWFIEKIDPWDISPSEVCLHLTSYKLPSHQATEKLLGRKVSKLRRVTLVDARVEPGRAEGQIQVNKRRFNLTYAWGGINSKENWHKRESYTIQVRGSECEKFFIDLIKQINALEKPKKRVEAISTLFPFIDCIKPYRLLEGIPSHIPEKQHVKYMLLKKQKETA